MIPVTPNAHTLSSEDLLNLPFTGKQDSLTFDLVEKPSGTTLIIETTSKVFFKTIGAFFKIISDENTKDPFGHYELSANNCERAFTAIIAAQASDTSLVIHDTALQKIFNLLKIGGYIGKEKACEFQSRIQTFLPVEELEKTALKSGDPLLNTLCAYYFRTLGNTTSYPRHHERALWHISKTRRCDDFALFLLKLNDIDFSPAYACFKNPQIIDAAINCPSIYKFFVRQERSSTPLTEESIGELTRFLTESRFIKIAWFQTYSHNDFLNPAYVNSIVRLLQSSTTIETLIIRALNNEGLRNIIQAIENNPNSSIRKLFFDHLDITQETATQFIALLEQRRNLICSIDQIHKPDNHAELAMPDDATRIALKTGYCEPRP